MFNKHCLSILWPQSKTSWSADESKVNFLKFYKKYWRISFDLIIFLMTSAWGLLWTPDADNKNLQMNFLSYITITLFKKEITSLTFNWLVQWSDIKEEVLKFILWIKKKLYIFFLIS